MKNGSDQEGFKDVRQLIVEDEEGKSLEPRENHRKNNK